MSSVCTEVGRVIGVDDEGFASVKIQRVDACNTCEAKGACQALGGKTEDITLRVENTKGARTGDIVVLALSEVSVITASATVYLIPAAGLIGGALLGVRPGAWLFGSGGDLGALLGALLGLVLGLGVARLISGRLAGNPRFVPTMIDIQSSSAPVDG